MTYTILKQNYKNIHNLKNLWQSKALNRKFIMQQSFSNVTACSHYINKYLFNICSKFNHIQTVLK